MGRSIAPYLAVVTRNDDPAKLRRLRATAPTAPGIETDWLRRINTQPSHDAPLPKIGQTILVFSVEGDPLNGWWMLCSNAPNPPLPKANPQLDLQSIVEGEQVERTDGDRTVNVGASLILKNDAGASITLAANGSIIIEDAGGNRLSLDGTIAFATASLSIAGKQIATVGAVDSDGEALVSKGW
ncbi:MAG: phage baseplate assembly protein V [Marinagarivorans sp.]|nr:phage baseplate assembly protein V [Marinagarivorans sp.]